MKKLEYNAPLLEVIVVEPEEVIAASNDTIDMGLGDDENDSPSGPFSGYRTSWNNRSFGE